MSTLKVEDISDLVGKTVTGFELADEGQKLSLHFGNKSVNLYAQGDCCSSSWFEVPTGEEALYNAEILSIEFVDLNKVIEVDDYEVLQHYSLKVTTTKGYFDAELRNSSNGYYGGSISINEDDQYSSSSVYPSYTKSR